MLSYSGVYFVEFISARDLDTSYLEIHISFWVFLPPRQQASRVAHIHRYVVRTTTTAARFAQHTIHMSTYSPISATRAQETRIINSIKALFSYLSAS